MSRIIFTVTNDLSYDQRMQRIAGSLSTAGYEITLVGRKKRQSPKLEERSFRQKRLPCFFNTGMLFYIEYNIRLFFLLLFFRSNIICAIDLDTILPCYFASLLKNTKRVYDAHEWFPEQKEIITRPYIHKIWLAIERFSVPRYTKGYTVNDFIAQQFLTQYGAKYEVIRNVPRLSLPNAQIIPQERFILYQGAVNEGRCFETLIPAMKLVNAKLVICGDGNFYKQTEQLIKINSVQDKVQLKGLVLPEKLKEFTQTAYIGLTLFEATGLNQYHSLANRFFDYIMAGIPQLCVNYPEYKKINDQYRIAWCIDNTKTETIADALNKLLNNAELYKELQANCTIAAAALNWEREEKKLLAFYRSL